VLTLQFNDEALRLLSVLDSQLPVPEPSLIDGLQQVLAEGITRRGSVLAWTSSPADADAVPGIHHDLTRWECAHSSFHVEDYVAVSVVTSIDGTPGFSEPDQRLLLTQALIFAARGAAGRRSGTAAGSALHHQRQRDMLHPQVPPDPAWRALEPARSRCLQARQDDRD